MMFATLDNERSEAHKVGASMGSLKMLAFLGRKQRTSRKTTETLAFRVESEATRRKIVEKVGIFLGRIRAYIGV